MLILQWEWEKIPHIRNKSIYALLTWTNWSNICFQCNLSIWPFYRYSIPWNQWKVCMKYWNQRKLEMRQSYFWKTCLKIIQSKISLDFAGTSSFLLAMLVLSPLMKLLVRFFLAKNLEQLILVPYIEYN